MADSGLDALPSGVIARPLAFSELSGWVEDRHAEAFRAFHAYCVALTAGRASLRLARPPSPALLTLCSEVAAMPAQTLARPSGEDAEARAFFEAHFTPHDIIPESGKGFLTAYYEPELRASPMRSAEYPVPVLARPADLVTIGQGETLPGIPEGFQAVRRAASGHAVYPDRAAIWAGALEDLKQENGQPLEVAWLRDEADLFITQVQGSARLRYPDGSAARLVYAGRNGHPYTSIGKKLVERGEIALPDMTLERLMGWLRADPARGRALMEENASYVFFALAPVTDPAEGPIGGAGVPLHAGRSLAIDRTIWPYGLPVFIETAPLAPEGGRKALNRLMIASDTGSAILGPARGDFFMGSGDGAGTRAGLVRDPMRFVVLLPKDRSRNRP